MQNPTVSGQQQIAASKISNTAAGQLFTAADGSGQQHMMMVPTAGTQVSFMSELFLIQLEKLPILSVTPS